MASLCTQISEVNIAACFYRTIHDDLSPIIRRNTVYRIYLLKAIVCS